MRIICTHRNRKEYMGKNTTLIQWLAFSGSCLWQSIVPPPPLLTPKAHSPQFMQCGELGISMATKFHNRGRKNNPLQGNAVIAVPRLSAGGERFQPPAAGRFAQAASRDGRTRHRTAAWWVARHRVGEHRPGTAGAGEPLRWQVPERTWVALRRAGGAGDRVCCAPVPMMTFLDLKAWAKQAEKKAILFSAQK